MMHRAGAKIGTWITVMAVAVVLVGAVEASAQQWRAEEVRTIEGFETPESVLIGDGDWRYVSNIVLQGGSGPWDHDDTGYISRIGSGGDVEAKQWRTGEGEAKLGGPKGMCIVGDHLYAADIHQVVRFSLSGEGEGGEVIDLPGAEQLNDMATDGEAAYASDTGSGTIYRIDRNGQVSQIDGPPACNGIAFGNGGQMYAVSWGEHEVYRVDWSGGGVEPLGLAEHFESLDGIEELEDGTLIVSDFLGGKVSAIGPDREEVYTLVEMQSPADIGLDRDRGRLYVPSFQGGQVEVYELSREE